MKIHGMVWAVALSVAPLGVYAQAPDNTGVNKEDRASGAPTADQAKNDRSDVDLAKNIRRSIVKDKSLSTYAHNVKVVAQNGTVTLEGPVKSEEEKRTVVAKAASIVGDKGKVVDELTVKQ